MTIDNYKEWDIEIFDDPTYSFDSSDNIFNYSKEYFGEEANHLSSSKHGVKVYRGGQIISDCIVVGSGGTTTIHNQSILHGKEKLFICCGNAVFCLSIPSLNLVWQKKVDQATCFQIFCLEDDLLIHGELEITRMSQSGEIKWQFGGRDILISLDENVESLTIEKDYILLTDFSGTSHKLNFEGKQILSKE